jgi:TPR repeat protein
VDAGPFEDGEAAYKSGDYAAAVRLLGPLAEQGDAAAQYNLGVIFAFGHGVPQNLPLAATWYRKSADQGVSDAQYNLGFMYEKGLGVPHDCAEAAKLYRLAQTKTLPWRSLTLVSCANQTGRGCRRESLHIALAFAVTYAGGWT